MGIADSDGSVIARYSYDEWGKLLDIATAQENSEEQMAIAELNPLRYRGYYYDNETGMYYLQSRYYNPDLCRFISADGFDYIDTSNVFSANAYAYCWNNPVAFDDIEGTTPQISIDMQKVVSFFKNANDKALQKFSEHIEKLQIKFNAFAEKTVYYLKNPDELINNTLSKIFGREVKIRFWFIEALKKWAEENAENNSESSESNELQETNNLSKTCAAIYTVRPETYRSAPAPSEKTDNWLVAALKGLTLAIQLDSLTGIFEGIIQTFNPSFDFNEWFKNLSESNQDLISGISLGITTVFNKIYNAFKDIFDFEELSNILKDKAYSEIGDFLFETFTSLGGDFFSLWENFANVFNGYMDGTYSGVQGISAFLLNVSIMAISIYFPSTSSTKIFIANILTNAILDLEIDLENWHFWG